MSCAGVKAVEAVRALQPTPVARISHADWLALPYTQVLVEQVKDLSAKVAPAQPVPPMTPAELLEVIGARDLLPLTEALCRKVEAATVARCGRTLA